MAGHSAVSLVSLWAGWRAVLTAYRWVEQMVCWRAELRVASWVAYLIYWLAAH